MKSLFEVIQEENVRLKAQVKGLDAERNAACDQLAAKNQAIEGLYDKISDAAQTIVHQQREIDQLNKAAAAGFKMDVDRQHTIAQLRTEMAPLQAALAKADDRVGELLERNRKLTADSDEQMQHMARLRDTINRQGDTINRLAFDLAELRNQISERNDHIRELQAQVQRQAEIILAAQEIADRTLTKGGGETAKSGKIEIVAPDEAPFYVVSSCNLVRLNTLAEAEAEAEAMAKVNTDRHFYVLKPILRKMTTTETTYKTEHVSYETPAG